ncbi:GGDEF domain-containing protein [Desulfonatronovibrio magnus]|uniref:GGDEF domain-containing protein n=1 Tax=Desulfonatronovibrio magnus TaxID=698827 RepID=UPI0005EB8573|nr:GGDEF domain-containing protein [Desulfonatronovibrio magnus]
MSNNKVCNPLSYEELSKTINRLGIKDESEWLSIILFVRNLVSRMDIITLEQKYKLQKMVLQAFEEKDFSEANLEAIIKKIQQCFTENIKNDINLVEQKLNNEQEFTETLINQIQVLVGEFKKSVNRQSSELNNFSEKTISDIELQKDPSHIIGYIKGTIRKIVLEARKEAVSWENRARNLENIAKYDNLLKNLYNRNYFDEYLSNAVDSHHLNDIPLSLLMIDVDHFKNINDEWGHLIGDDVLKALAKIIRKHADMHNGVPCRYGGEELCIIFDNTYEQDARSRAEELRKDVEMYNFVPRKKSGQLGEAIRFTISIGVAQLRSEYDSSDLISAADKALYMAKNSGRNRVKAISSANPESEVSKSDS